MDKKTLANCIKNAVKELKKDNPLTYKFELDDRLAVYVGWGDGFDTKDDGFEIHSKSQPSFCVCTKIAENVNGLWEDAYMPWDEDGEVYDTDHAVSPKEDYNALAEYLLSEYAYISERLDNGTLTF